MNFKEMSASELQSRMAEIRTAIDAEDADLDALEKEAREIREELESRAAAEAKKEELRKMVAEGKTPETKEIETQEERKMPDMKEIRSSQEYASAYLKMLKTRDDSEVRALLTTNTTAAGVTGYVPVPTALETEIKTAWETHQLMGLIKKSTFKGNVKIGFELTAGGASVHVEGAAAPDEEVVTLGAVEIKADMIKKWIRVSDEALEGTTVDTAGYLYKEIAHRIVEKAEEVLVGKITAAGTVATATAVGVPKLQDDPGIDTVLNAMALLCGEAGDLHIAMNRGTYPAFRNLELNANYGIDVFEGLRDRIIFTDKLPAVTAASTGATYMIVGDFADGVQANFPNGDQIMMLTDPYTDAQSDLVKIVGRQYVGMAVVGDKRLVNVTKEAAPVTG
jgi:HK97 family phage major capsid protein